MTDIVEDIDLGLAGGDTLQKIAIGVPAYTNVSTAFFLNFSQILCNYAAVSGWNPPMVVGRGPYPQQNMRMIWGVLREQPEWERLVIVETDMILQREAILKHALHTDPVVGSLYFQHAPPFYANVMLADPAHPEKGYAHLTARGTKHMIDNPALYKADIVSFGCTSIRRDVLEKWPDGTAIFANEYSHEHHDEWSGGEVSHDIYFCRELAKWWDCEAEWPIWLDTTIVSNHLTEAWTGPDQFLAYHHKELATSEAIHLPNRAARRKLGKLHVLPT